MTHSPATRHSIWGMPLLLAALTAFGLLAALLGSGLWHPLAWLALAIPVAVALYYSLWPQRVRGDASSSERK